jgi:endonuclease/exonuclease/phosphatase family metal-dependent hydrolase
MIEFNGDWSNLDPYSDIKDVAKVDHPEAMNQQFSEGMSGGAEKTVGKLDMIEATLLNVLAEQSRAVCHIIVPAGQVDFEGQRQADPWSGTGFLVAPNILLTNYHVLNSAVVASKAVAEFDYQVTRSDLLNGPSDASPSATSFHLMPERLFITSTFRQFDYAFVWIEDAAAQQFGTIPMTRGSFLVRKAEPTFVLHHPGGHPKKASVDDTEVLSVNANFVLYAADTAYGSSGAPVFEKRGRLAALHHAWWPVRDLKSRFPTLSGKLNDGSVTPVANEGIKLSAIAIDLEMRVSSGGSDARDAATVLAAFNGSDSLTGMFGSLGRTVDASKASSAESDRDMGGPETVVQMYEAREQDIDIGAWNIECFNRDYTDPVRLERVATVIADLGLDIWALLEVSRDAVEALLRVLRGTFRQDFKVAYSEPDAGSGKQSTAVIWRPNVVECTAEQWPDDLARMFCADSSDDQPFEAVHGKVFNCFPGLFRIKLKSADKDFDFYLVPLHLKARQEESLLRKLAVKALACAVDQMIKRKGSDRDWILLGDMNATLASGEFEMLQSGSFTALSAEDERNGAMTYLKSPYKSFIDHIFVSDRMKRVADENDFYIIESDRSVGRFLQNTSDHWPIALRLSLSDLPSAETGQPAAGHLNANDVFQTLLGRSTGLPAMHNSPGSVATPSAEVSKWHWKGRTKTQFFHDNRDQLESAIADTNLRMAEHMGAGLQPLTLTDVAAVYMAEAGLEGGKVDPDFVHSAGEYGLLPLPSNIPDWIGPSAPAYDRPMTLDRNIRSYLDYLCAIRNKVVKTVGDLPLYPGLFRVDGIVGSRAKEAKLLAGIVHGYFYTGSYDDHSVPYQRLLAGYASDHPIDQIMAGTSYIYAGHSLLKSRQSNINEALHSLV